MTYGPVAVAPGCRSHVRAIPYLVGAASSRDLCPIDSSRTSIACISRPPIDVLPRLSMDVISRPRERLEMQVSINAATAMDGRVRPSRESGWSRAAITRSATNWSHDDSRLGGSRASMALLRSTLTPSVGAAQPRFIPDRLFPDKRRKGRVSGKQCSAVNIGNESGTRPQSRYFD